MLLGKQSTPGSIRELLEATRVLLEAIDGFGSNIVLLETTEYSFSQQHTHGGNRVLLETTDVFAAK